MNTKNAVTEQITHLPRIVTHILVIETNQYSGNFEREMAAYVVGALGDCEVGSEFQEMFFSELEQSEYTTDGETYHPLTELADDVVEQVPDDNGTYRPVKIWPSENQDYNYHSVAIFFNSWSDELSTSIMELVRVRATAFADIWSNRPLFPQGPLPSTPLKVFKVELVTI